MWHQISKQFSHKGHNMACQIHFSYELQKNYNFLIFVFGDLQWLCEYDMSSLFCLWSDQHFKISKVCIKVWAISRCGNRLRQPWWWARRIMITTCLWVSKSNYLHTETYYVINTHCIMDTSRLFAQGPNNYLVCYAMELKWGWELRPTTKVVVMTHNKLSSNARATYNWLPSLIRLSLNHFKNFV